MALALAKYPFSRADWDEVQSFDCGSKDHQREVSDWLKGPEGADSALSAIHATPPAHVYLYRLEDPDDAAVRGELVGFGALGQTRWRWTGKKDPFVPLTILIWFAVRNEFKRQPPGDPDGYYASQILDDLIAEALERQDTHPILGLCVRPENVGAIDLYRRKGFSVELSLFMDKQTGVEYLRMARILSAERLAALLPVPPGSR
jgi:ribosomal protein S18 acetylase RimI-like enzyme